MFRSRQLKAISKYIQTMEREKTNENGIKTDLILSIEV